MLRVLGYPQNISIDHFRRHDFYTMAHILSWLIKQIDPKSHIPTQIAAEQDRVIFVKTAAQFLVEHLDIKVNPQKLYQANVYAVQEMLKVVTFLCRATDLAQRSLEDEEQSRIEFAKISRLTAAKVAELSVSRTLSTDIINTAAEVYDLLSNELEMREKRTSAIARQIELNEVDSYLKACLKATQGEIVEYQTKLNRISSDESNLESKIVKKKADLERLQKRLVQLQSVRPTFMDEYEKLESDFRTAYDQYVESFLNVAYLKAVTGGQSLEFRATTKGQNGSAKSADDLNNADGKAGQSEGNVERLTMGESKIEIWKERRQRPQMLTAVPAADFLEGTSEMMGNDSSNEYDDDEDDELLLESEYQETNGVPSREGETYAETQQQRPEADESNSLADLDDSPLPKEGERPEGSGSELEII